jgi:hypothetical protein
MYLILFDFELLVMIYIDAHLSDFYTINNLYDK